MKIVGIVLAVLIATLTGWLLFKFVLSPISTNDEVQATLIGIFGIVIVAVFTHYFAQKREIASRHFERKAEVYKNFFDLINRAFNAKKLGKNMNQEERTKSAMKLKKDLLIWASNDVLRTFSDFEVDVAKGDRVFKRTDDLILAVRRDLGHSTSRVKEGDMVKWFIVVSEHDKIDEMLEKETK